MGKIGIGELFKESNLKMPKEVQKIITAYGLKAYVRQVKNSYQIRLRQKGFNVQVTSTDFNECKRMFRESLLIQANIMTKQDIKEKITLNDYFLNWLNEVKKPTIKELTYTCYVSVFKTCIEKGIGKKKIVDISRSDIQQLINELCESGKVRTAKKMFELLKPCLNFAVKEEVIKKSPFDLVQMVRYEENHGTAFSIEEENEFIKKCKKEKNGKALTLIMFTGIRRSELASIERIDENFLRVKTAKVKKGFKDKYRDIPISPKLREYINGINLEKVKEVDIDVLTKDVNRITNNKHHLHDLRHTFITRCQECGIATPIVSVWAGHSLGQTSITAKVYTHISKEVQLKEIEKLLY